MSRWKDKKMAGRKKRNEGGKMYKLDGRKKRGMGGMKDGFCLLYTSPSPRD